MRAVIVCLALFLALVAAQEQFTGTFELRSPFMAGGVIKGEIQYSWTTNNYRLFYSSQSYQEIFSYNPARGYGSLAQTDVPFHNQWVYKSGQTCACETGPHNAAMPQMFPSLAGVTSAYDATGKTVQINGVDCAEYTRKTAAPLSHSDTTHMYWNAAAGQVCRVVFKDLRQLTFTSIEKVAPAPALFVPPTGCKCGQPIDMVIVLDRSGSITVDMFKQQKQFVQKFTQAFSFGPESAHLAMVDFMAKAWVTLPMSAGVSDAAVAKVVNDYKCDEGKTGSQSCTCCGTSVSSGIRLGALQLKEGRANIKEKIMLVLTDGAHNTFANGSKCVKGWTSAQCNNHYDQDLRDAIAYVKAQVSPDVKFYSVAVGKQNTFSAEQLSIICDYKPERNLTYTDFDELAAKTLDIVARACQENINPCGAACCGFCVCGQCTSPDVCEAHDFCTPTALESSCCRNKTRDCVDENDKCNTYSCDAAAASCVATEIKCKPNTACFNYTCNPVDGICQTKRTCAGNEAECTLDSECDDGNKCTKDICDKGTQMCKWESTAALCNDGNECTIDSCDIAVGCVFTNFTAEMCDDYDECTTDTCDPAVTGGCVHTNITCVDNNQCTVETCHQFRGCLSLPMNCSNDGTDRCTLNYCANGTCVTRQTSDTCAPIIAVATVLTTAAVVGIVVGVVLLVAGIGAGGAFAYSQAAGSGNVAPVMNNPIYNGQGNEGQNPLFRGS